MEEQNGKKRYVGIDLSKRSMEVCILVDGEQIKRLQIKTSEAGRKLLMKHLNKDDCVAIEACSYAFLLYRAIRAEVDCTVYVLNPGRLQMIWKSMKKTDKEDALQLARFIQRNPAEELPIVAVPEAKEEKMRTLVSMQQFLTKTRTSFVNRLHALYLQAGITDVTKADLKTEFSRAERMKELPEDLLFFAEMLEAELKLTEEKLADVVKVLEDMVRSHELSAYLLSVPGVGLKMAAAFLAYIGDGSRFSNAKEVANYAGLVPRLDCSGDTNRYGHITKSGCRAIRSVVIQSVWALSRSKSGGRLQAKFELLSGRMTKTKSAIAIARKMVTTMWVLVRHKNFYAEARRTELQKKFRYYKLSFTDWDSIAA